MGNHFDKINILTAAEMQPLVSMREAITAMAEAFTNFSLGKSVVPQRLVTDLPNLYLFAKPAYDPTLDRICIKILSQKKSAGAGPTILGIVLLIDAQSGAILAMLEGGFVTALRTGAASGLATRLLARENASRVAIFGCGAQARIQLEAIRQVRQISHVYLFDRDPRQAEKFKEELSSHNELYVATPEGVGILSATDIICTATNAHEPLFPAEMLAAGTHINAIGSFAPDMQEIDPVLIKHGRLFVDSRAAVLAESGDLRKPIAAKFLSSEVIVGELGELVSEKVGGRRNASETTIFKSVGLAVQDLFVANLIYEKYRSKEGRE
jgi:ornithine cyclodeaminase